MLKKLCTLIEAMKTMSESMAGVGETLSVNTTEVAASITQITASLESIKKRVEYQAGGVVNTSDSIERIMAQVEELDMAISEQVNNTDESANAAKKMADNIGTVTQTLEQNVANIESLEKASQDGKADAQVVVEGVRAIAQESEGLKEINSVIENIASQTNLLSMNAAIEAAHAGEVGKGFAVVADEIRKLAENSSEQSKTINSILQKITTSIDGITASTDVMLKGFDTIEENVSKVSHQEGAIRDSMMEQESGSQNIKAVVEKLKVITENVKKSSGSIASEGSDVREKTNK
jgi:methyl-accepting chemotaxis protein